MHQNTYVKVAILSLVLLLGINSPVEAMFPSLDGSAIGTAIKNGKESADQVKNQVASVKGISKIKTAIGDAKASIAKFKADTLAKVQAAAEKAKKEMAKVEAAKKKIQEAKKKYEEQKAKFDAYQKKLEDAKNKANKLKETASAATSKIKNTAQGATAMASAAASKAGAATGASGNKTSAATDGSTNPTRSGGVSSNSSSTPKKAAVKSVSGNTSPTNAPTTLTKAPVTSNLVAGLTPTTGLTSTAGLTPTAGSTPTMGLTPERGSATELAPSRQLSPMSGLGNDDLSKLPTDLAGTPKNTLSKLTALPAAELPGRRTGFTDPLAENANTLPESSALGAALGNGSFIPGEENPEDKIKPVFDKKGETIGHILDDKTVFDNNGEVIGLWDNKTKEVTDTTGVVIGNIDPNTLVFEPIEDEEITAIKKKAAKQGIAPATQDLQGTLKSALQNRDMKKLDAISKIDIADIVKSDSKIYEEKPTQTPGRKAFSVNKAPEITTKTPPAEVKQKAIPAEKKIPNESKSLTKEKIKTPTKLKKSSIWLKDGKDLYQQNIKISSVETLKFANAAGGACTEFGNTIFYSDKEEVVILPKSLAEECCIKAEELTDMQLINDCIDKVIQKMNGVYNAERDETGRLKRGEDGKILQDNEMIAEAQGFYSSLMGEQVKNGIRDGLADSTTALDYIPQRFDKYVEQITGVGEGKNAQMTTDKEGDVNIQDIISSISMTNEEMMYLLNNIRRIYSSFLVSTSMSGIGEVGVNVFDENAEAEGSGEYGYSITRTVDKKNSVMVDYPVIPEDFAKKYAIKVADGVNDVPNHYKQIVQDLNDKDMDLVDSTQKFVERIQYQEVLNATAKSIYQKVRAAKYQKVEDNAQSQTEEAADERRHLDAMLNSSFEMIQTIDDIINLYASRIAYSSVKNVNSLSLPIATGNEQKG